LEQTAAEARTMQIELEKIELALISQSVPGRQVKSASDE
jgi:hypothetical protein